MSPPAVDYQPPSTTDGVTPSWTIVPRCKECDSCAAVLKFRMKNIRTLAQTVSLRWSGGYYQLSNDLNNHIKEFGDITH